MKKLFYHGLYNFAYGVGIALIRWPFLWLAKLFLRLGSWAFHWEMTQIMAPGRMTVTMEVQYWEALIAELQCNPHALPMTYPPYSVLRLIEKDLEFHKLIHTPGKLDEWYTKRQLESYERRKNGNQESQG